MKVEVNRTIFLPDCPHPQTSIQYIGTLEVLIASKLIVGTSTGTSNVLWELLFLPEYGT